MSAADTVTALEFNLITESEAIEQAMVDDLNCLYRKAVIEIAPQLAVSLQDVRQLPC